MFIASLTLLARNIRAEANFAFMSVRFMNVLRHQLAQFHSCQVFIEVLPTKSHDNEALQSVNLLIIVN
jgi:hypothetical protein